MLLASFRSFSQDYYLFVGTYTGNGSKGIYVYRFNATYGTAEWVSNTDSITNPSYLAVAPNGKYLYAVNETHNQNPGSVSAFAFDRELGQLNFINQQQTGGDDPCYVSVSKDNKWVMVANYSGGSLTALQANADGSLNPASQVEQHVGKGVNVQRQEKPHVHAAVFDPAYNYVLTPDLGLDKIFSYRFTPAAAKPLTPASKPFTSVTAGSGPRHLTFHPNNRFAYVIEELTGTVAACTYANGKLSVIQQIATHPSDFKGTIGSADIHCSPDGKFLYASNRGSENTITIFAVNQTTGKLSLKGFTPTLGNTPRNFTIDPTGNFLLVANQQSNNVAIFKRDKVTGLLQPTGKGFDVPNPVCLKMLK